MSILKNVGLKRHIADDLVIKELKDRFRARLRVAPIIEVLPKDVIQRINFPAKSRKPVKFVDER